MLAADASEGTKISKDNKKEKENAKKIELEN